jgi:hypothetical protein
MISSFWVSVGLLMGILATHLLVPPASRLLRLPSLPNPWIVGALGLALGTGRFWTLFIAVNALSFAGRSGLLPPGWFAHAVYTFIGLITLLIYMLWISAISGHWRNRGAATLLAPLYAAIVVGETVYVYLLLRAAP